MPADATSSDRPAAAPGRARRGPVARFLLGAVLVVLCTSTAGAAIAIGAISQIAADIASGGKQIKSSALTPATAGAAQTIMVIGDDHSGPIVNGVRLLHADTFMLIRLDPQHAQTSILSIPRDLLVNFSYKGQSYTDQKFNSAYSLGGPDLVLHVVKKTLPGVSINNVVDFSFASFIGVVRAIGCVYVDVDHRYLNETDQSFSKINIEPGYQRLCANQALSYVRYRHTDSDFVRVARQQDFIRQAKGQLGLFDLLTKYDEIAKALGKAIDTNIRGVQEINALLRLIAFSGTRPIRHVTFETDSQLTVINGEDYVTATPQLIGASVDSFLYQNPTAPPALPSHAHSRRSSGRAHHRASGAPTPLHAPGLFALPASNTTAAIHLAPNVPFKVEVPGYETGEATANDPSGPNDARTYSIADESGRVHYGYRIDWQQNTGGYYGVEGINWLNPPLFASPSATQRIGGRTYLFIDDGSHWHDIGWREHGTLYWVSNTLLEDLTNAQMLALAESTHPIAP
jgi:LCP family protein required for cell wall assembly